VPEDAGVWQCAAHRARREIAAASSIRYPSLAADALLRRTGPRPPEASLDDVSPDGAANRCPVQSACCSREDQK